MMFDVIIPSARASNLIPCVRALLSHEPDLPPARVIVVDDGARAGAEGQLPGITWVDGVKPFNFARNINRGLAHAAGDVFLLNDDALLDTPRGFSRLAVHVAGIGDIGLCSAAINGMVGNPGQLAQSGEALRDEAERLAFVCVFLPARTHKLVGPLDERFSGYGFEDDDYCLRVAQAGRRLTIWDGCIVRHDGALPSTYRIRPDHAALFAHNKRLFTRKWTTSPPPSAQGWRLRVRLSRTSLPPAALDRPAFWYLAFHDDEGNEIARLDANPAELSRLLSIPGDDITLERLVPARRPPASWTLWPVDRRRRWLEKVGGPVTPDAIISAAG
jgi:GT2 family glycosyltransferase